MSLVPLNRFFIEQQIKMNLKAILEELPQYRCMVGIPGKSFSEKNKYSDFIKTYNRAKRNAKKMGKLSTKLMTSVFFELTRRATQEVTDIATYAAKQEFGSYSENTPPRPFLKKTFTGEKLKLIRESAQRILTQCATQNRDAKESLEKLGLYAAGEVKKTLTNTEWLPNSEVTQVIKGSDKPLIDTGTMRRAVTAWVDKNVSKKALYEK
jgi:hypothetical protein